jgi:hypothetical protein
MGLKGKKEVPSLSDQALAVKASAFSAHLARAARQRMRPLKEYFHAIAISVEGIQ